MSVLSIDDSKGFELQTQILVGRSIAVLGITGSGKTNTSAVLIEELLSNGLPLTIVDIEGEYWGLKELFEILVAGRSEHSDLEVDPANAGKLAEISLKRSISVILDLSDFTQEEAYEFLLEYFKGLWAASSVTKQPYQIVLEEAHEFVPQSSNTPLKQVLTRIALRGRKRGLGIILVSQRSAKVEKDVLTQASLLFLHKVVHPIDLRIYKDLIPSTAAQVENMVRRLQPGEAIMIYNHEVNTIHLRLRHTFHAGSTPAWNQPTQPKLRKLDAKILKELRALTVETDRKASSSNEQTKLTLRVKELEEVLALKEAEIQRLREQIDLLSKLSISIEGLSNSLLFSDTHTLNVDQALVRRLITGEKSTEAEDNITNLVAPQTSEPYALQSEITLAERHKLDSIIQRFRRLPKLQRSILRLLFEHEGTAMTIPMMASWLALKENTIRNHPPYDLLKMKLVTRARSRKGYKYTSAVSNYFRDEFPRLEMDTIFKEIFSSL